MSRQAPQSAVRTSDDVPAALQGLAKQYGNSPARLIEARNYVASRKGDESTEVKIMDAAVALLLHQGTGQRELFDLCLKLVGSIGQN